MNQIIVGMGEALWDVLPEGKKIGGAPANFAYHVSQFGFDSRVVSAIGDDKLGNEILENFDSKKLNYLIEKVPYPTGTVQVELDPNGVPMYDIKKGWPGIIFLSLPLWRNWPGIPVRYVSVRWHSAVSFHGRLSTVSWIPCPTARDSAKSLM